MAQNQKILTYRVRQLPKAIDKAGVHQLLRLNFEDHEPSPTICVHSLSRDLASLDASRSKTATVTITPLPLHFANQEEWTFRTLFDEEEYEIIVDLHFLGFTVLNEVHDTEHVLDCIAISGLGSHAFGSWQQRQHGSTFMWLRDGIPHELPGTRVMIYGYDTQLVNSNSFQNIQEIAAKLVQKINDFGLGSPESKPLVILAHSLGGIVLKESLLTLASTQDPHTSMIGKIKSIYFFGVPHKGMETTQLMAMVKGNPNEKMIHDLSRGSSYLLCLERSLYGHQRHRKFVVVSLYETKKTKSVNKSRDGTWSRSGPEVVMVDRDSATSMLSKDIYPINEDHSAMVKFALKDTNYEDVISFLRKEWVPLKSETSTSARPLHHPEGSARVGEQREARATTSAIVSSKPPEDRSFREGHKCSEEEIRESLHLDVFKWRLKDISPNYSSTFDWVFDEEALGFVPWLLEGHGVYWIHGKPGSGKSTLMKYIYDHDHTFQMLNAWKGSRKLIKTGFFFYYRGSAAQKSFEGLIRSMLSQILDNAPELCREIPRNCLSYAEGELHWNLEKLKEALLSVLQQKSLDLDICLFIDALDEFDGHLEVISDFIKSLVNQKPGSLTRCKICFSSRPKNIIGKNFGHFPNFQIHDYTKEDIKHYTDGKMEECMRLNNIHYSSPEQVKKRRQIVREIVLKANGVFLWVRLALENLFEAVKRPEVSRTQDLTLVLRELPLELDQFYQSIVSRIHERYRRKVFLTLEVLLRSSGEPTLKEIQWIISNTDSQTLDECLWQESAMESSLIFCQRLKDQCGGLIEIKGGPESYSESDEEEGRITFLHETVREFVSRPGFKNLMLGDTSLYYAQNGYTELAKLYLSWMRNGKAVGHKTIGNEPILQLCASYCNLAELSTGEPQAGLIDGLQPEHFRILRLSDRRQSRFSLVPDSALSFAVTACLILYMEERLKGEHAVLSSPGKPLVHVVIEAAHGLDALVRSGIAFTTRFAPNYAQMLKLLLDAGTSKETTIHGLTPFERLLLLEAPPHEYHKVIDDKGMLAEIPINHSEVILHLAQVFLEQGQDQNVDLLAAATDEVLGKKQRQELLRLKPIHIASERMLKLLLNHQADVNSTDRKGRTALDYLVMKLALLAKESPSRSGASPTAEELSTSIGILIKNGDCITRAGLDCLPESLDYLSRLRHDISDIENLPHRSKASGYITSTDLLRRNFSKAIPPKPLQFAILVVGIVQAILCNRR